MSDLLRSLLGMFAVIAPLGAVATLLASRRGASKPTVNENTKRLLPTLTPLAALAVLAVASLVHKPVLDWLNASPESFQFAAAIAMAPLALRLIIWGDSMPAPEKLSMYSWLVPFAVPLLAGPSSVITSMSYGARFGDEYAILASAIVLGATGASFALLDVLARVPLVIWQTAARFSGGLLVLVAVELAIDGVHSV